MKKKFLFWLGCLVVIFSVMVACQTTKKGDSEGAVDCAAYTYIPDCQARTGCVWDYTYARCNAAPDYTTVCRQLIGVSQCQTNFNCVYNYSTQLCVANTVKCPDFKTQPECQQYSQYCNWIYQTFACSNRAQASIVNCSMYTTVADCNRYPNDCMTTSNTNVCVNKQGTQGTTSINCNGLIKSQCDANTAYCSWNYTTNLCEAIGTTSVVCSNFLYESQCKQYPSKCSWNSYTSKCVNY